VKSSKTWFRGLIADPALQYEKAHPQIMLDINTQPWTANQPWRVPSKPLKYADQNGDLQVFNSCA